MKFMKFFTLLAILLMPFQSNATVVEIDGINYFLETARASVVAGNYSGAITNIKEEIEVNGKKYPVTSIQGAFHNCIDVTSVEIPSSITYIYNSSFANSGITTIAIPETIHYIEGRAFEGCKKLTSVSILAPLTYLGEYIFSGCDNLSQIILPKTITRIGSFAFEGCSNLETVHLSEELIKIEGGAFSGCTALKEMVLPESVQEIGASIFKGCSNLRSIVLTPQIQLIPMYAFSGCSNLEAIDIPSGVQTIVDYAFEDCASLQELRIPHSVLYIYDRAFSGCIGLKRLYIDMSTIETGKGLMQNSLEEVILGEHVKMIGIYALNAHNLKIVRSNISSIFSIEESVFSDDTYEKGTLFVPVGTKSKYQSTSYWNKFQNIKEEESSSVGLLDSETEYYEKSYTVGGIRSVGQKGLTIFKKGNGISKKAFRK